MSPKKTLSQKRIINKYLSGKASKFEVIEKIYGGKCSFNLDEKNEEFLRKNGYGDLADIMLL
jgi:hypothetical protein